MSAPTKERSAPRPERRLDSAEDNAQPDEAQVHITLRGRAAEDVTRLTQIKVPDLWHVAHWPELKAHQDAILLLWYVGHHLKDALEDGGDQ
jgi:hypothetical protein